MADIVTSRTFVDGEKNITAQKLNDIVGSSVIQPAFVSAKPSTSTVAPTDNLLVLTAAGGTYAKAPFQTIIDSVSASLNTDAEIWRVRLRSHNAVGNATFEVDQRNVGNTIAAANGIVQDRWAVNKSGTNVISAGQNSLVAGINLPGTSFAISRSFLRVALTTAEPTLAAGDFIYINQNVEGIQFRELQNDVHSLQVLVRSSVANLAIGMGLRDPSNTHSLTSLATLGAANTWVLLPLANLPLWTASGTFVNTPGNIGYQLSICLAAGSTYITSANGTWQNGNFLGAVGQSNFAASPVNSTFDVAFVQHEPGAVCSTPIDSPFEENYRSCQRYFSKSHGYAIKPGVAAGGNPAFFVSGSNQSGSINVNGAIPFPVHMAKTPTCTMYHDSTFAANTARMIFAGTTYSVPVTAVYNGETGMYGMTCSGSNTAWTIVFADWVADTGW
jgi:hypothetical protein